MRLEDRTFVAGSVFNGVVEDMFRSRRDRRVVFFDGESRRVSESSVGTSISILPCVISSTGVMNLSLEVYEANATSVSSSLLSSVGFASSVFSAL